MTNKPIIDRRERKLEIRETNKRLNYKDGSNARVGNGLLRAAISALKAGDWAKTESLDEAIFTDEISVDIVVEWTDGLITRHIDCHYCPKEKDWFDPQDEEFFRAYPDFVRVTHARLPQLPGEG